MMVKGLICLLAMAMVLFRDGYSDTPFCPPNTVNISSHCYLFFQIPKSWHDAQDHCTQLDGRLVSLIARPIYDGLMNVMRNNQPGKYWLSGAVRSGNWIWTSNGSPVSRALWGNRVVPTPSPTSCVYLCSNTTRYWAKDCNEPLKYICEKNAIMIPEVGLEQSESGIELPNVDSEESDVASNTHTHIYIHTLSKISH
ncbi:snaclec coagulation factor IX/factor X-binding protein subunit B-like [Macrobrachium rosenbergii]|uniref:snaclec coagulation factor IX/factor X-binding protein subunit B-like n=1 Tax=Macrobrachium rosenbergii TaxID=79674 RepID=UPI0034D6BEF8